MLRSSIARVVAIVINLQRRSNLQPRAIARTLKTSQVDPVDIDAIAYTRGPGMRTCLAVSAISAKALGAAWRKPVIGIHHMVSE